MHTFFYKMKMKFQRYAIRNLAVYASVAFAIGYLMLSTDAGSALYSQYLAFYPRQVLHGQIWRIFTALLYPPSMGNVFSGILGILIYYSFASTAERMMGEFEFNVYFFGSFLIGEAGNIIYYLITGFNAPFIPLFTQFSVFMAFAIIYADAVILLFFIIPLKAKYLAIFELALYTFYFIVGDSLSGFFGISYTRISIIAALIPIYLFYRMVYGSGKGIISDIKDSIEKRNRQKQWRDQWK